MQILNANLSIVLRIDVLPNLPRDIRVVGLELEGAELNEAVTEGPLDGSHKCLVCPQCRPQPQNCLGTVEKLWHPKKNR